MRGSRSTFWKANMLGYFRQVQLGPPGLVEEDHQLPQLCRIAFELVRSCKLALPDSGRGLRFAL